MFDVDSVDTSLSLRSNGKSVSALPPVAPPPPAVVAALQAAVPMRSIPACVRERSKDTVSSLWWAAGG
jgi:hypothetical protein